jgi:hypothetical protein
MEGYMAAYIDWPGKSGKAYRYFFIDLSQPIDAVPANYTFAKCLANGNYWPLYFGETDNAKTRPLGAGHERWADAIAAGMTHVMAHSTLGGVAVRCAEERDLVESWQPVLNIQYRRAQ